jgi:hypothetical protein
VTATVPRPPARQLVQGDPFIGCSAIGSIGMAKKFRVVSETDIGPNWSHVYRYDFGNSSEWEVGYQYQNGWSKAGFGATMAQGSGTAVETTWPAQSKRYQQVLMFDTWHNKVNWQCSTPESPGPVFVQTTEPTHWDGGTAIYDATNAQHQQILAFLGYSTNNSNISCAVPISVAPNTTLIRQESTTTTYSANVDAFGFSGQGKRTFRSQHQVEWTNASSENKTLCGESAHPLSGNTRVTTSD